YPTLFRSAEALGRREVGARVEQDHVSVACVQQRGDLGSTHTYGVRQQVQGGQHRGGVGFRSEYQQVQAHRHRLTVFRSPRGILGQVVSDNNPGEARVPAIVKPASHNGEFTIRSTTISSASLVTSVRNAAANRS